jgi:hypothetical protein
MMTKTEKSLPVSRSSSVAATSACVRVADRMKHVFRALVERISAPIASMNCILEPVIYSVLCKCGHCRSRVEGVLAFRIGHLLGILTFSTRFI